MKCPHYRVNLKEFHEYMENHPLDSQFKFRFDEDLSLLQRIAVKKVGKDANKGISGHSIGLRT